MGVVVLLLVLAFAGAFAVVRRRTDGRVRSTVEQQPVRSGAPAAQASAAEVLTADELGGELGAAATLVQFSSAFCAPCRGARVVLGQLAAERPGVVHRDVDAESHLDLVRRLDVRRTPTTFVLDARGTVVGRVAGVPRSDETGRLLDALGSTRPE
ncbi:UNVERIFIED_CONTAM: hypothetical protein LK11_04085 [Mumia flava]